MSRICRIVEQRRLGFLSDCREWTLVGKDSLFITATITISTRGTSDAHSYRSEDYRFVKSVSVYYKPRTRRSTRPKPLCICRDRNNVCSRVWVLVLSRY